MRASSIGEASNTPSGIIGRAELSAQDRSWLQDLDDLCTLGENLEAIGKHGAVAELEPAIHDLIDKLRVRRGEPGAEDRRRSIEARGGLSASTLAMLDRYAAPRRKPSEDGLKDKQVTAQFVAEMQHFEGRWSAMSPTARLDALGGLVNARLRDIGVPPLTMQPEPLSAGNHGRFHFPDWSMRVNQQEFSAPRVSSEDFARVLETVYHEARHAEQWYLMARVLAQHGRAPDIIAEKTSIPRAVCESAAHAPPLSRAQADAATVLIRHVYADLRPQRDHVQLNMTHVNSAAVAAEQALRVMKDDPNVPLEVKQQKYLELKQLYADKVEAYRAYAALPDESDAIAVGAAAAQAYRSTGEANLPERAVGGDGEASTSRGVGPVELSAQDRGWLQALDDLRKRAEVAQAGGQREELQKILPLVLDLVAKLGVRRAEPGAEDKRAVIAAQGNLPPQTLAMLDRFRVSRADLEMMGRENGLKGQTATAQFAHDMHGLDIGWAAMTPAERADALGHRIHARLRAIGVPVPKLKTAPQAVSEAYFDHTEWSIVVDERTLAASPPKLAELTNSVYHEARHGEQYYLIARMMTKDGVSPAQVAAQTGVLQAICEAAAREPPLSQAQRQAATNFYESQYGKGRDDRRQVMDQVERCQKEFFAVVTAAADPKLSPEQKQQKAQERLHLEERWRQLTDSYRALPMEKDAWEVGDAAEHAYRAEPAAEQAPAATQQAG